MKTAIVSAAAVLLFALTHVVSAEPPRTVQGAQLPLGKKILGAWEGRTGCAGNFVFRADGTYELTGFGPAGSDSTGTWKLQTDTMPPTLVLTCKTSDLAEEVGTATEFKLVRLADETLAVKHAGWDVARYERAKK